MRSSSIVTLIMVFFLLLPESIRPQSEEFKKNGTAGFTFLELPVTARSASLGESSIALADLNSAAVFRNPAGLGFTDRTHSFSASYSPWIADIKNYAGSYSYKSGFGIMAVSFVALDYGTMPRTFIAAGQKVYEVNGTFSANAVAVGLSYSKKLTDKFSFGATLKYANEKIDIYSAYNILFDGGVLYYTGLSSLRIAASINNFGVDSKFISDEFKMPAVFRLGAAAEVLGSFDSEYRVTMIFEAIHPNDSDEKVSIGSEISWRNIISFRGGYKFFYDEESYSAGIGITPGIGMPVTIDFGFADYGRLGSVTRFSLQLGVL